MNCLQFYIYNVNIITTTLFFKRCADLHFLSFRSDASLHCQTTATASHGVSVCSKPMPTYGGMARLSWSRWLVMIEKIEYIKELADCMNKRAGLCDWWSMLWWAELCRCADNELFSACLPVVSLMISAPQSYHRLSLCTELHSVRADSLQSINQSIWLYLC